MAAPETLVTDTGAALVTGTGAVLVTEGSVGPADPSYDLLGAIDTLFPGIVVQRELVDAAAAQYAAKGFQPLAAADVPAILAAAATTDVVSLAIPSASNDSPATPHARAVLEVWRQDDNAERRHSRLG